VSGRLKKFEEIALKSHFYTSDESIFEVAAQAKGIIDLSNQFGEGWLLAEDSGERVPVVSL
jgi:predicted nucleotide-binding protein (sugar kinase/HSP70/actin superfamily)